MIMETNTINLVMVFVVVPLGIIIVASIFGNRSRFRYIRQSFNPQTISISLLKFMKPKTRFTKLDEFYKAINVLIEWLNKDGHQEDSEKLNSLMHTAWTTGSELLGEIMLALKSMKGNYSPELRAEINECFQFALHHRKILGLSDGPYSK
jgi:hypothetical protein